MRGHEVATARQKLYDVETFQAFIKLPENADGLFELIDGEILEVSPGRTRNSEIGLIIASTVRPFCRERSLPCHISGSDGAYNIHGNVVAPDFAYKTTPMSEDYPDLVPPLWVVEIISPTDKAQNIRKKRQIYIQANILYWELYPEVRSIDVYAPGQPMKTMGMNDILDGGEVLPDFRLAMKDLFEG